MKIKPDTELFQIPFGSHLYGTNGPNSDYDYKVVCLPSLDDLLLNKQQTNRKVLPEGKRDGEKMNADEAEYEYIPLQVFFNDFFAGQTYALEIAFAVLQMQFSYKGLDAYSYKVNSTVDVAPEDAKAVWAVRSWMEVLVKYFLTSNVKKMVGYAVSQSQNYGLKTERYTSLKEVIEQVQLYMDSAVCGDKTKTRLEDARPLIDTLTKLKHVKRIEILNGAGGTEMSPAIEICGKQFPLTTAIVTMQRSLNALIMTYGDRVKKYDGEGVDWKALSHAIRITEQVLELSKQGSLTFPRPNAEYLKAVKEGKVSIDEATKFLTDRFNELDEAVANSVLQDRTPELTADFEKFKVEVLTQYYVDPLVAAGKQYAVDCVISMAKTI